MNFKKNRINTTRIMLYGCFAFESADHGGQPVKSRETYWALEKIFGIDNVHFVETENWKKHPIRLLINSIKGMLTHEILIMLPASNGLRVFSRILYVGKKLLNRKIYYDVIGGWLPKKLSENEKVLKIIKGFDGIWVETETMYKKLTDLGLSNIVVLKNFKHLELLKKEDLEYPLKFPLRVCTFSRVVQEKGIEDAVNAVKRVNDSLGSTIYALDIYGEYPAEEREWFERLSSNFPDYVNYKGVVDPSKSVEVLKGYFALLFPTRFYTEGIPGTIIDAYTAGVPVISARWESFSDVIDDGVVGLGFEFGNQQDFVELLVKVQGNPTLLLNMRVNCLEKANDFTSETGQKNLQIALSGEWLI